MEIEFLKMQGCGDDTIIIDTAKETPLRETGAGEPILTRLARRILDRHFGVGGNSLVLLGPGEGTGQSAGLSARSFDEDGDPSVISPNALRCVARYASDSGSVTEEQISIEAAGGASRLQIIDSLNVRLDMGMPFSRETQAEIREKPTESFVREILVDGRSVSYTPISLGRSYAIIFTPNFSFPLKRTARRIAEQPDFPQSTGIGFVQVYNREEIRLRAWEGDDPPPGGDCACAAAAIVASVVNGFTDREFFAHLKGGDIFMQWQESDNRIYQTGPAQYVFTGTWDFEPGKS